MNLGRTMNRRFVVLIVAALMSISTGCSKKAAMVSGRGGSALMMAAFAASPQRYIAEHHKVEIITPESDLQKAWESTVLRNNTVRSRFLQHHDACWRFSAIRRYCLAGCAV